MFLSLKKLVLDLLFPVCCVGCGKSGDYACFECLGKIGFIKKQQCPNCRKLSFAGEFCSQKCQNNFYFDSLICASKYQKGSILQRLIMQFKHKFSEEVCGILVEILLTQFDYFRQIIKGFGESIVVPVPIHEKRLKYRGFNQSERLAEALARHRNLSFCDMLFRKDFSLPQSKLKRAERFTNLKNCFDLKIEFRDLPKERSIILLDDVATTGSTLNECAKVLKSYGASKVYALVLARADFFANMTA